MKLWIVFAGLAGISFAQVAVEANKRYQTVEGRNEVSKTLDDPHRDENQKPLEILKALHLKHGQSVADVGTGTGYMLPFLSKAVGSAGFVYAEDIFADFLEKARERARKSKLHNVQFVKGNDRTTNLQANSVNVVMILDAYHHFDFPGEMLASISKALKNNGRLAIIDFYKTEKAMPNGNAMQHIRLSFEDMVKEVEANGFKFIDKRDIRPDSQYLALFEKK